MGTVAAGWRNLRESFPLWGWMYLGKLILALAFTLPILAVVNATLDNSTYASVLLKSWSLDVITELMHHHRDVIPAFVSVLIFYAVIVFLFKQFLNGGIYHTFLSPSKVNLRKFFAQSAALFRGNLKVSLLMFLIYLFLAFVSQALAGFMPPDLAGHFGVAAAGGLVVRGVILYLFLISGSIFSDVLRFRLAAHPDQKFSQHLKAGVDFYLRAFVKLNGLYYVYFIPMVVLWLMIEKAALTVTGGLANIFGVFLELILFQLCSFARTGQSLLFTATLGPIARTALTEPLDVPTGTGGDGD